VEEERMVDSKEHGACTLEEAPVTRRSNVYTMADTKTENETALIEGWERTNDILGHKPKFDVICVRCKESLGRETKMQVRHTGLKISKNAQAEMYYKEHPPEEPWAPNKEESDPELNLHLFGYKCPYCAWFIRFQVPDTREYLQEIYKKRNYNIKLVPLWETDDMSEEELKSIERQMVALGYWAGR